MPGPDNQELQNLLQEELRKRAEEQKKMKIGLLESKVRQSKQDLRVEKGHSAEKLEKFQAYVKETTKPQQGFDNLISGLSQQAAISKHFFDAMTDSESLGRRIAGPVLCYGYDKFIKPKHYNWSLESIQKEFDNYLKNPNQPYTNNIEFTDTNKLNMATLKHEDGTPIVGVEFTIIKASFDKWAKTHGYEPKIPGSDEYVKKIDPADPSKDEEFTKAIFENLRDGPADLRSFMQEDLGMQFSQPFNPRP